MPSSSSLSALAAARGLADAPCEAPYVTSQLLAHTIPAAVKITQTCRSKLYEEIAAGRLKARKIGRKTVILDGDLREWLTGLPLMVEAA